ncbi:MAG TPA: dienelactone hydrolase family protein [Hyphomicrobiaceae bacterium]|jgi:carboxymethylenebutenolidase|nr:dienelactone hydrolase family protein [Hyphomicrobiaceae bacterium]
MTAIDHGSISLQATDGHRLEAYRASPRMPAGRALVVLQEIFGVNAHIREVCDAFARRGYLAVAPALFDRAERGVELGYDSAAIEKGRRLRAAIGWDAMLLDVSAAVAAGGAGPVAVLGYCWGGTLAFLAAARLAGIACAVGYYGGQTAPFAQEKVQVPLLLHFGEFDPRTPPDYIDAIRRHNPQIEIHLFPADHGFNCDHRKEWHEPSARSALQLSLAFLDRHMPARPAYPTTAP